MQRRAPGREGRRRTALGTRARCRQASLPRDEVDYIWLLSDLDMDGAGFPLLLAHCLRPLAYPPAGIPALP